MERLLVQEGLFEKRFAFHGLELFQVFVSFGLLQDIEALVPGRDVQKVLDRFHIIKIPPTLPIFDQGFLGHILTLVLGPQEFEGKGTEDGIEVLKEFPEGCFVSRFYVL